MPVRLLPHRKGERRRKVSPQRRTNESVACPYDEMPVCLSCSRNRRERTLTDERRADAFPCFFKGEKKRGAPQSSRYCDDAAGKPWNERGDMVRLCRERKEYAFGGDRNVVCKLFPERNTRIFTSDKLRRFEKKMFSRKNFLGKR